MSEGGGIFLGATPLTYANNITITVKNKSVVLRLDSIAYKTCHYYFANFQNAD